MKAFYRLINYEFSTWLRALLLLCIGTIATPLVLLNVAVKEYNSYSIYERYEDIYVSSGCVIVFLIYLTALFVFFIKTFYASYWGSKSIYTILTLPIRREVIYLSKLTAFFISILLFLAAQYISIRLGYELVSARIAQFGGGQVSMNNGFFLAIIRSEFFRLLLPLSISRIVSSVVVLITLATGIYYALLCERSKVYWAIGSCSVAWIVIIRVIGYRMTEEIYRQSSLFISSAILVVLSIFFVWHSIRLIKRGAIA